MTPASPAGTSVGATDKTLSRARGVPNPRKSWTDRLPRGGVTIRFQEREPGPPLGPALRRHQLHPRSGARRACPGLERSARSSPAGAAPEPLGSFPLHHRGELGAFSSVSGPPCFSLRPRQRCDGSVSLENAGSSLLGAETRKAEAAWRLPPAPWHARAPEPAGTVVSPNS